MGWRLVERYASIYDPRNALYFEALEGVTIGLMLSAGMTYACELSTTKNVVSLQALSGTLYYGVGKGAGCLVGGYMYHHLGARKTFRMMTVASLLSAIIFLVFQIYMQHRNRLRELNRTATEKAELLKKGEEEEIQLKAIKLESFKNKGSKKWRKRKRGSLQVDATENGVLELRRVTLVDVQTQTEPVQFACTLAMPETYEE
ncbi:Major facilitator superfamily domain-containing protein 6 [Chionoecetes opilio]|uniref:Major facilitator superfamily domain-containing protein 6 n=1 Tax=Chionoecetes opilio TaxID=41210 RepID=A0A8J5CZT0_CHIOP|nr:Major facilitator superfamily domain-containing protein 6 [Chionoecetes opilio]